jgi:hypothetical protein
MQGISLQRVLHFPTNIEISLNSISCRHYSVGENRCCRQQELKNRIESFNCLHGGSINRHIVRKLFEVLTGSQYSTYENTKMTALSF